MRPSYDDEASVRWSFRIDPKQVRAHYERAGTFNAARVAARADAEHLLAGRWELFGGVATSPGWPPRWDEDPLTGARYPASHWSEIPDDDPAFGDIKDVWELSRFGCTFVLARAFVLTGDSKYAEAWWEAVEDWAAGNPPNRGVNWRCAQESSLRAIAWCFGWSVFAGDPSSTPDRTALLDRLLGATVRRVRPTLGYALSQRNNHAISELTYLLSLPGRRRPRRRAERLLREALDDQFFPDGSYVQQSLVYHRLAVQELSWLLVVGDRLPESLRGQIRRCLARSADLLDRCTDPITGQLMNYGANDGSLLFPIGHDHPLDARPTLALLGRPSHDGSADELAMWLSVDVGREAASGSTYTTMGSARTALLTRLGTIARRAGDGDQQAVELMIDGARVVLDPGTFRYNTPPPWRNPFVGSHVHSMATSTTGSVGPSIGRFLRAPVAPAEVVVRRSNEAADVVVSRRLEGDVELHRTIVRVDDRYAIVDEVRGGAATVRWNLTPMDLTEGSDGSIRGQGPANVALDRGDGARLQPRDPHDPGSGWWAPTYGVLEPCTVVEVDVAPDVPVMARFAPADREPLTRDEVDGFLTAARTT